ncbi:ATP-dependent zinc metalloprotease FtsH [Christensenellaceae bacterium 44-20]
MKKKSNFLRGPLLYVLILLAIFLIAQSMGGYTVSQGQTIEYSQLLEKIEAGEIGKITISANEAVALKRDTAISAKDFPKKYDYYIYLPSAEQFDADVKAILGVDKGTEIDIEIAYEPQAQPSIFVQMLPELLMTLLMIGVIFFMFRQTRDGGKTMGFGKSKAKMVLGEEVNKTFGDVAGADEEKAELAEVVEFLKDPKKFTRFGARIPKGVLLVGPPGCGKTLLAKAVAGEAGIPFFSITGSDFVEMFVGMGAARVRDLFDTAKKNSPCIIFIDEIDAVGRQRGAGLGGGHDEREQTLNQLLTEMDGFVVNDGIIVIAATNRVDILDPALLRPGRFDRQVVINYPDVKGREDILKVHAKGKPLAPDVDLAVLAKRTPGMGGADLENVLNEAAILAARYNRPNIGMEEIEEAVTKVMVGPEKKSRVITEEDKKITAYHEVGHAICAKCLPNCDPVHEISIIPRGMAAGYTMTLPDEDKSHYFKSKMLDEMTMMLGGRAAEALILGDITTGASNDIERATNLARGMVVKYGMSDVIGPVFHGAQQEVFLGKELVQSKACSEEVAAQIDAEMKRILTGCMSRATEILSQHVQKLHEISHVLMEKEKIDGEEFEALFAAPAQAE